MHGASLTPLIGATVGAVTMVFASAGFDAHASLQAISDEGCAVVHGVPTMFFAMLDDPAFEAFDLSSLRTGVMAGSIDRSERIHSIANTGGRAFTIGTAVIDGKIPGLVPNYTSNLPRFKKLTNGE